MPLQVNGELIPIELIREEEQNLARLPAWQDLPEGLEKGMRLREAAESAVIDRILLRQQADKDPRPVDAALVDLHVERLRTDNGCRVMFDDVHLRGQIEGQLRLQRTMAELMGPVPQPSEQEILRFFKAGRERLARPEMVHAAHIVKNVDETHPEAEARAGIEAALAELEGGAPFAEVADRHSDCKGNGGDLGSFPRGNMVEEFDNVVFNLRPGQRSPIFRTSFGFHIAEVRERTPAQAPELREVRDTIREFLVGARQREAANRVAQRLRSEASIRRVSKRAAGEGAPPETS